MTGKIAGFAPIPRAKVRTATAVKPGLFARTRRAKCRSFARFFTRLLLFARASAPLSSNYAPLSRRFEDGIVQLWIGFDLGPGESLLEVDLGRAPLLDE